MLHELYSFEVRLVVLFFIGKTPPEGFNRFKRIVRHPRLNPLNYLCCPLGSMMIKRGNNLDRRRSGKKHLDGPLTVVHTG